MCRSHLCEIQGTKLKEKWEINEIERRIGRELTGVGGLKHSVFLELLKAHGDERFEGKRR